MPFLESFSEVFLEMSSREGTGTGGNFVPTAFRKVAGK
jgi:hypothetical protein